MERALLRMLVGGRFWLGGVFSRAGEGAHVRAFAEEECHDEGVGEADFGAVDEAIADSFDEGKYVVVLGVEDEGFYCCLGGVSQMKGRRRKAIPASSLECA